MNNLATNIADLSPQQRAVLELKLQAKRQNDGRVRATTEAAVTTRSDEENRVLAESQDSVDGLLAKFYRRFPWPWQPIKFDYLEDTEFGINMLNQDIGDFSHRTVPRDARIWVAGCGTNQALHTALKFIHASTVTPSNRSKTWRRVAVSNTSHLASVSTLNRSSPPIPGTWSLEMRNCKSRTTLFRIHAAGK